MGTTVGKPVVQTERQATAAQEQVNSMALNLYKKTEGTALAFSDELRMHLVKLDVQPEDFPLLAAACLVSGAHPDLLRQRHNVAEMVILISKIKRLGYQRKEDYNVVIYKSEQPVYNPDGSPRMDQNGNQVKAKQPTISVQLTEGCYVRNAEIAGKLKGVENFIYAETVENESEAKEIFVKHGFDERLWCKESSVARGVCKTVHPKIGLLMQQEAYGIYSPMKFEEKWDDNARTYVKTGKIVVDKAETGRVMDNYYGPNIAKKLAKAAVARQVTRDEFPRSDVSTYANVAGLIRAGNEVYEEISHKADEAGVSFDEYLANQDAIDAQVEQGKEILEQVIERNTLDASSKNSDGKKTETSSLPSAEAEDASSRSEQAPAEEEVKVVATVEVATKQDIDDIPFDMMFSGEEVDKETGEIKATYEDAVGSVLSVAYNNAQHYKPLADYITTVTALNNEPELCTDKMLAYFRENLPSSAGYRSDEGEVIGNKFTHMTDLLIALLTGGIIDHKPSKAAMERMFKDLIKEANGQKNKNFSPTALSSLTVARTALAESIGAA